MFTSRKKLKLQGKDTAHRKSLIKSQITELIRNGRIKTTPKKAKAVKASFDRLVTLHKRETASSTQKVKSFFGNNTRAVERLEEVVEEKLMDRNSGYTRIIKTLNRPGDNAEQAYLMLVNTEVRPKVSKTQKLLNKRQEKKENTVTGRISKAVKRGADKTQPTTKAVSQEKQAKTRRNSK